ncbi:MAG: hypothetical protein RLY30_24 [Pseudomonadota bacterium]|jgi:phosphate acetyltransferase
MSLVENCPFNELEIGDSASISRTLTARDIEAFAAVSWDTNPAHLDPAFADHSALHGVVGHGMWTASILSTLLGTQLPGPGTIYLGQTLRFLRPVHLQDTVTARVRVVSKDEAHQSAVLHCEVENQRGERVLEGEATVRAPRDKVRMEMPETPTLQVFDPGKRLSDLIATAAHLEPVRCAVVHPCDEGSLQGAMDAAAQGLIVPILIGPRAKIESVASSIQVSLTGVEVVDVAHSHEAAERAAAMAGAGEVEALMKGSLHTDELMHAVVAQKALRTKRRFSHVFRFDVPLYSKPIMITDAALNIAPTLMEKRDIIQNAIDLAVLLGCEEPRVAILSAVESINPSIPSTLDAAALCKMADRGQIQGGVLDGPLAFDNAVSPEALKIKSILSPVAGQADILMVPDLESGNMLSKQLEYLAGASGSGVVVGARVPIALTSRADGPRARAASALLVKRIAHQYRLNRP